VAPENLNPIGSASKCFFEERPGAGVDLFTPKHRGAWVNFFSAPMKTVYMVMNYESGRSLQEHVVRNREQGAEGRPVRTFHPARLYRRS